MKVLQINTRYKNGGSTGRIVYDLMRFSEQEKIQAFVAYGYEFDGIHDERTVCMNSLFLLVISKLQSRIFSRHGFYNYWATKKLLNYIEEIKPDIIHLHNIHNHYIHCGLLFDYIKKHDVPVIWTLHDCWAYTGWCAYFDYSRCNKWQVHCNKCPSKKDYPFAWFTARASSNYDLKKKTFCGVNNLLLVSPSRWMADLTRKSFLNTYPSVVINNGVDTDVFKPVASEIKTKLGIGNKYIILAMASGFDKRKGGEYIKQLPKLMCKNEVLLVVGKGAKNISQKYLHSCIGIEYTNDVSELVEYYTAADVFINPTLEDNFPTTNIEALACGTPVVTFRTGGSIESVLDDEEPVKRNGATFTKVGAVVEKGDLEGMLQASREIIQRGKSAFIQPCRAKAVAKYNKDKQYLKYVELYKSIKNG